MSSEIYLNSAGTSHPKPKPVLEAIAGTLAAPPGQYPVIYRAALDVVKRSIGSVAGHILMTSSCTQALDVAISDLPWKAGDVVLTSHLEHNAVIRPVRNLVKWRGVKHVRVPYHLGEPIDLQFVSQTLKEGKTRLLVLCSASNVTGEILPLAEISQLAHQHGALVFADAAQTFGLLQDTAASLAVDLFAFAGHKGPLGPQRVGGLWVKESVQFAGAERSEPEAVCEIGGIAKEVPTAYTPGYCDVGGVNMPGIAGLAAGLQSMGQERAAKMQATRELAAQLAHAARAMAGVTVYGHCGGAHTATVSLGHEHLPVNRAEAYFASHGLRVRAGAHCAPDALSAIGAGSGTVRISFGPSNVPGDLDRLLAALSSV